MTALPGIPITLASPPEHLASLPEAADAVIIGGGIIGVLTGWFLARAGLRTVLVEKGRVAGEQSSRNWGWIRKQARDLAELPVMIEAARLWPELAARAGEEIGLKVGGVLYLADTAGDEARFARLEAEGRAHGTDISLVSRAGLEQLMPQARGAWRGGLLTASDMAAEPWAAVPSFARAAVRDGLIIREGCAARGLETSGGALSAVVTEAGVIRTERALLAGGAWSRLLLRAHGMDIPQLSVRATVALTEPMPSVWSGGAADGALGLRQRQDGGYVLAPEFGHELFVGPDTLRSFTRFLPVWAADPMGTLPVPFGPPGTPDGWHTPRHWGHGTIEPASPFERLRILNPAPGQRHVRRLAGLFHERFPGLPLPRLRGAWAGMIDSMPDMVPVVDAAPLPGLWIGTGMSGHGFGIGPGFGRVLADLMQAKPAGHDLSRFRYGRFGMGQSALGPG